VKNETCGQNLSAVAIKFQEISSDFEIEYDFNSSRFVKAGPGQIITE